jgi:hypothetical protein
MLMNVRMGDFFLEAGQAEKIRAAIARRGCSYAEFMREALSAYLDASGSASDVVVAAANGHPRRAKVSRALGRALRDIELEGKDAGTIELAKHYAASMDADPKQARYLGSRLLETLIELQMTPRARQAILNGRMPKSLLVVGADDRDEPSGLEVLRAKVVLRKAGKLPLWQPEGAWPCPSCSRSLAAYFVQGIGICPHCDYRLPPGYPGPSYAPPGYAPPSL